MQVPTKWAELLTSSIHRPFNPLPGVGTNLLQKMGAGVCSSSATEVEVAGCFCQMGSFAEEAIQPLSSENLLRENGVCLNQEEGKWGSTVNSATIFKQKVDFLDLFLLGPLVLGRHTTHYSCPNLSGRSLSNTALFPNKDRTFSGFSCVG